MNQSAALRDESTEPDLQLLPLDRSRAAWEAFADSHRDATLYHHRPWLEVLRRGFGVNPMVAIIGEYNSTQAACLLARGGNPIRRGLISLPFSDYCPPLAVDDSALRSLMSGLPGLVAQSRLEIRGTGGSYPWHVLHHFQRWTLDLSRPFQAIERAADREVRRHMRRAREAGVSVECSRGAEAIETFFELQLESRRRLGVPSQPLKFFRLVHEVFAKLDAIEVWFASHEGKRIAGVVVLRDGHDLHAKWSARTAGSPDGASHLIFMSIGPDQLEPARRQQMIGRRRVRAIDGNNVHAGQHLVEALPVGRVQLAPRPRPPCGGGRDSGSSGRSGRGAPPPGRCGPCRRCPAACPRYDGRASRSGSNRSIPGCR